jgi:endonuclease G, mitochondrial
MKTFSDNDIDYSLGYKEGFLLNNIVKLPIIKESNALSKNYVFLHYHYLSIYFNKERTLALYSACNYNKDKLIEKDETGKKLARSPFKIDISLDEKYQLGEGFYLSKTINHPTIKNKNIFDRGHIISRRYTQWGDTSDEAKRNADDTFYFTNISPQVWQLNQHEWQDIEAFVIEHKKLDVKKVSIFSGSIFNSNDPIANYLHNHNKTDCQIRIPLLYWKIVYYLEIMN